MYEIDVWMFRQSLEDWVALWEGEFVPSHSRHFVFMSDWAEPFNVNGEDANAVSITLLGMLTKQLLTNANTEDRLLEVANDVIKPMSSQIRHDGAGLALSRKQHAIG